MEGDVALAALEDVDGLLMRQSLEGRTVHANDLKVDQRGRLLRICDRLRELHTRKLFCLHPDRTGG